MLITSSLSIGNTKTNAQYRSVFIMTDCGGSCWEDGNEMEGQFCNTYDCTENSLRAAILKCIATTTTKLQVFFLAVLMTTYEAEFNKYCTTTI